MSGSFIDYDGNEVHECWNCGGEGTIADCFEEFACLSPDEGCDDCTRPCDVCDGRGSFTVTNSDAKAAS